MGWGRGIVHVRRSEVGRGYLSAGSTALHRWPEGPTAWFIFASRFRTRGAAVRSDRPGAEAVLDHLPVGVLTVDAQGRVESANAAAAELFGPAEALRGRSIAELLLPEEAPVARSIAGALRGRLAAHLVALPFTPPGAERARVLDVVVRPFAASTAYPGAVVVVTDVTERVEELARARLFYQSFLHSHEAMEVTDRDGVLVDVNPAFERIYGYARAEVVGQKPRIVRSPKTAPGIYKSLWTSLLDPTIGRWSGEIINLDRHGVEHPVLLTINAIRDERGTITHFIGVATDLSEQKAFELQVARADRLASVGQLAAGVAHELNTPLANIMLIAESLHRRAPNPWVTGRADAITRQVEAASRIVSGLLDFSRHHPPRQAEVDAAAVAHEAIEFAKGKQSPDVDIDEEHAVEPLWVWGARVQLLQVFVNLINNAIDAMEGRGRLTVRSGVDGREVWVSFADTGIGIPPSVMPHIFEPFFTTKADGKGTGLGLSIVHGIVQAHGGSITVASKVGEGTTFRVRLPHYIPEPDDPSGSPA